VAASERGTHSNQNSDTHGGWEMGHGRLDKARGGWSEGREKENMDSLLTHTHPHPHLHPHPHPSPQSSKPNPPTLTPPNPNPPHSLAPHTY
jgi:hypothetical protein